MAPPNPPAADYTTPVVTFGASHVSTAANTECAHKTEAFTVENNSLWGGYAEVNNLPTTESACETTHIKARFYTRAIGGFWTYEGSDQATGTWNSSTSKCEGLQVDSPAEGPFTEQRMYVKAWTGCFNDYCLVPTSRSVKSWQFRYN